MPYSITTTSGRQVATVQDATINTTSTSLTLIGRDYAGYGAFLNENFIHLLENFASGVDSNGNPASPLLYDSFKDKTKAYTGQLWYDTSINTLKVWNEGLNAWRPISSSLSQNTTPTGQHTIGDLWFKSDTYQLYVYTGDLSVAPDGWKLIGPSSAGAGGDTSGLVVESIDDSSGYSHIVIKVYIENAVVGIFSTADTFTPQISINGFSVINPGFNLVSTSAIPNTHLTGDASNALRLNGATASQFLRADQNTATPHILGAGRLVVDNNLTLSGNTIAQEFKVSSTLNNYNLNFYNTYGGNETRAIGIDGATGAVTVYNNLSTTGTFTVTGDTTLDGTTTLQGITTLKDNIVPGNGNTINIGGVGTRFAAVYADNFSTGNVGTFTGNVVSKSISVGSVNISELAVTVGGSLIATQNFVNAAIQTTGMNSRGQRWIRSGAPGASDGNPGDIWYQV